MQMTDAAETVAIDVFDAAQAAGERVTMPLVDSGQFDSGISTSPAADPLVLTNRCRRYD
jgi:hypothetical protein